MSFQGIRIEKPQEGESAGDHPDGNDVASHGKGFFWILLTLSFLFSGISLALAAVVYLHK